MKNPLEGPEFIPGVSFAVVPSDFIRSWRQWCGKPTHHPRPTAISNRRFICDHNLFILDPSVPSDLKNIDICFIRDEHFDLLADM